MKTTHVASVLAVALLAGMMIASSPEAQSSPSEQDIIDALLGFTGHEESGRGVTVEGGEEAVPAINLKVNFEFDSAQLDNESILTLNTLGRALSNDALRGQVIEIIGHTDASGTLEYNDELSERRAGAVVEYLVQNFGVDPVLISSRGMGERQLLDSTNPESGINRRVEIRNVTQGH
ncbi:MAG: OmpA family protein [Rhodobacteraceae bacterium]|nr:OmpA family protein [Paracoccaceae bacterium]MCY4141362.1 OmpA family protein [Paracoccaceae bacterium]